MTRRSFMLMFAIAFMAAIPLVHTLAALQVKEFKIGIVFPEPEMVDPAEGYRWLMRAALADDPAAQEMLAGVLADGAMAGARTVIAPDLVPADMWLRLAARSPFHDNTSLRRRIEANMTAALLLFWPSMKL